MKRRLDQFACLALLLVTPLITFAAAGWTEQARVAELTPSVHHRYFFRLLESENPSGCKSKDTFYQDYNVPGSEFMFRALLAAVESGQRVQVYVTGKCDLDGYSEISSVRIMR